jgi:hypothetical protein
VSGFPEAAVLGVGMQSSICVAPEATVEGSEVSLNEEVCSIEHGQRQKNN